MRNSLDILISELEHLISVGDVESALPLMKSWLDTFAVDFRLYGKVFASRDLDQLCLKIGNQVLKNTVLPNSDSSSKCSAVFIASEVYISGGHTRLLEDYVHALGYSDIKILVTDPTNNIDRSQITEYFANLSVEVKFSPRFTSLLTKLEWLIENLALLNPQECYLLNHANDPVAVAGMQPELVRNPVFVHHCDHTFTLGIHLPQSKHVDFRIEGFNNCRNNLGIANNILCPLVAPDLGCPSASGRFFTKGNLHTCTSGGYKFEIPYAFQLMGELPKWLKLTGGTHTHIGELSTIAMSTIRKELNKLGIPQDRFKTIPFVKSLWHALIDQNVDLYIDSFPLCGARSVVEAMGAGIPITIHHNYSTPLGSDISVIYPEAKIWQSPLELENWLINLDAKTLELHSQFARKHYLKHHHPDRLTGVLKDIIAQPNTQLTDIYQIDALRAFMDQFIPVPSDLKLQKELLSQLVAYLRLIDVNETDIDTFLKEHMVSIDYNLFLNLKTQIKSRSNAIDLLHNIHPILNAEENIDLGSFSKLLYQIATANWSGNGNKQPAIGNKIKAKLLYHRFRAKCIDLLQ